MVKSQGGMVVEVIRGPQLGSSRYSTSPTFKTSERRGQQSHQNFECLWYSPWKMCTILINLINFCPFLKP